MLNPVIGFAGIWRINRQPSGQPPFAHSGSSISPPYLPSSPQIFSEHSMVFITTPFLSITAQVPICSLLGIFTGSLARSNGLAPITFASFVVPSGFITGGTFDR